MRPTFIAYSCTFSFNTAVSIILVLPIILNVFNVIRFNVIEGRKVTNLSCKNKNLQTLVFTACKLFHYNDFYQDANRGRYNCLCVNRSVQVRHLSALPPSGTRIESLDIFLLFNNLKANFHCTHLSKKPYKV